MTEYAYSTDNPETVAAFREVRSDLKTYLPRLRADLAALGGVGNPLVRNGIWGSRDELVGLEPDGSGTIPDGWRLVRGRLEPRRGKPGASAREWLAAHQPPDMRHTMAAHGLPRNSAVPTNSGSYRMVTPALFEHKDTLWACYEGKPGDLMDSKEQDCTWTPRKLSEFWAAKEAFDAAQAETAKAVA